LRKKKREIKKGKGIRPQDIRPQKTHARFPPPQEQKSGPDIFPVGAWGEEESPGGGGKKGGTDTTKSHIKKVEGALPSFSAGRGKKAENTAKAA